mmetsp:Transcript_21634/g.44391  ORF Transcript_21634/g.44391 Transcript_21634/m.44391 type:complete len:224 (+) Transcript_21634:296-967(+)
MATPHSPLSCSQELVVRALGGTHGCRDASESADARGSGASGRQYGRAADGPELEAGEASSLEGQCAGVPSRATHCPVCFAPHRRVVHDHLIGEELTLNAPLNLLRMPRDLAAVHAHGLVHGAQGVARLVAQTVRPVLCGIAPAVHRIIQRVGLLLQGRRVAVEFVRGRELGPQLGVQGSLQLFVQGFFAWHRSGSRSSSSSSAPPRPRRSAPRRRWRSTSTSK